MKRISFKSENGTVIGDYITAIFMWGFITSAFLIMTMILISSTLENLIKIDIFLTVATILSELTFAYFILYLCILPQVEMNIEELKKEVEE